MTGIKKTGELPIGDIANYEFSNGKKARLMMDGGAVNFRSQSALGPSILTVQAGVIKAAANLSAGKYDHPLNKIGELSINDQEDICRDWINVFGRSQEMKKATA
jgi:hypothetical protein